MDRVRPDADTSSVAQLAPSRLFVTDLIPSLNQNSGAITAIATVILVVITAWYAYLTLRLAKTAERQASLLTRTERQEQKEVGELLRAEVLRLREGLPNLKVLSGREWNVPDQGTVPSVHPWAASAIAKMARYDPETVTAFMRIDNMLGELRHQTERVREARRQLETADQAARSAALAARQRPPDREASNASMLANGERNRWTDEKEGADRTADFHLRYVHGLLDQAEARLDTFLEDSGGGSPMPPPPSIGTISERT
ncbi:MAG TPA: hypothetical protein VK399_11585 [Longimicrobiaceae bacterium]|nr:hypothetical protein [Longimicrobiaceae bacterium]